jgi:glucosamine-6-phosphate deaminase
MIQPVNSFQQDKLNVKIFSNESELGEAAAGYAESRLQSVLSEKGSASLILATGSSQFTFLDALKQKDLDWKKIIVFHLDEYIGISSRHPASFRRYLKERILDIVSPGKVYLINADAQDPGEMMAEYESLLRKHPVDLACIGIGENGHIAFNDPPVADFNDRLWVREVELDEACRRQQLGEGWFPTLDEVPLRAVTLTVPAIMNCRAISCVVPGQRKARAVSDTLYKELIEDYPSTILRTHPDTTLFLDVFSATDVVRK